MSQSIIKQTQVEGLTSSLTSKQDTLVSGTNIKTVNGTSILGPGNILISGGSGGGIDTVDASNVNYTPAFTSLTATNVQGAITELDTKKQATLVSGTNIKTINGFPITGSGNLVVSGSGGSVTADAMALAMTSTSATKDWIWNSAISGSVNAGDATSWYIQRNASYTGGVFGQVRSAMYIETFTPTGTHNPFEWGLTSVLWSRSVVSGGGEGAAPQNVSVNGTVFRSAGNAPVWAGNFPAYHTAGTYGGSSGAMHGIETSVGGNGVDPGESTIGLYVLPQFRSEVAGPGYFQAWTGILVANGTGGASYFRNGITNQAGSVFGYMDRGSHAVAIDLSTSTNSIAAIRLKTGDPIHFDTTSQISMRYNYSGVAGLTYSVGGFDRHIFADDGTYIAGNTIAIPADKISSSATGGSSVLPANPAGFVTIIVGGSNFKVPLYA